MRRHRVHCVIVVMILSAPRVGMVAEPDGAPATAPASAPATAPATAPASEPATAPTSRGVIARPTESVSRTGCVTADCHADVKRYEILHGPVNVNACDACHQEVDASRHTFELARTGVQLCLFCHQLPVEEVVLHEPVAKGQCAACHNPHGGKDRFLLKGGSGAANCVLCHEDVTRGMAEVHGPVAAGACTACHRAHSSAYPKLLTHAGRDLCIGCHATFKRRIETARVVHEPVKGECLGCHLPHASDRKMLLKQDTVDLCFACHEPIKDLVASATTPHAAVSTGDACRNCHAPHGSAFPALLRHDMITVCLSCHDEKIKREDGSTLAGLHEIQESGMSLHGPIVQQDCVACHQPHGGTHFRLLIKEYPPGFYAPFEERRYALCFECHNRMLVHDEKTTSVTNFRNGDVNLHFLHVNKKKKGRTCRACHATHASKKPKHIRDAVPFGSGEWKLPIRFEKTKSGGGCAPACHRPYRYDRVNPVSMQPEKKVASTPGASSAPAEGK